LPSEMGNLQIEAEKGELANKITVLLEGVLCAQAEEGRSRGTNRDLSQHSLANLSRILLLQRKSEAEFGRKERKGISVGSRFSASFEHITKSVGWGRANGTLEHVFRFSSNSSQRKKQKEKGLGEKIADALKRTTPGDQGDRPIPL